MSHGHTTTLAPPPARLALSSTVVGLALAGVAVGAGALGWAFARGDTALAWSAYLIGAFYALGLGVFGLA